jgi:sigma-B regulation protein RsbU (phosphoserine phosphatase)
MAERLSESDILSILDQIAREVSGELDLQSVLERTARLVKRVVNYSTFVIGLLDDKGEFDLAFHEGYSIEALEQVRLKADMGIIGLAVSKKDVIIVDDVSMCKQHIPVPTGDGRMPRSMLAVPLINKDLVIGAIGIECTELACFTNSHRLMMNNIASHLAAAVANAKMYEQTLEQIQVMHVIEQIGQDITSVLDLERLLKEIARLTKDVIDYQTFGIFLIDRDKEEFRPHFAIGYDTEELQKKPLKLDQGIRGEAFRLRRPILDNDVLRNPKHIRNKLDVDDVIRSQMYIPLETRRGILGVLVLGNVKKNFFNSRHLRIAHGMAAKIAIALENAQEYEEVAESEEKLRHELEIAKALQLSMLPGYCPYIPGYELQAHSCPATQVGGDFYDFIQIDDDRFGIVIGDVSGFGVSGALVMASAREVIRIYAEIDPEPASVMNRADLRLNKDLTRNMFVALLYGVLDMKAGTFSFCNAGLVEPILVRDGESRYLNTSGTRLPLGKMPGGEYKPRTIHLRKDDLIVLATDGGIELYNEDDQPFGFRRFIRAVSSVANQTDSTSEISGIIAGIFKKLTNYIGNAGFQDDVTLMTLKVTRDRQ